MAPRRKPSELVLVLLVLLASCAEDLAGIPSDADEGRPSEVDAEHAHQAAQALERSSASLDADPLELLHSAVRHACRQAREALRLCLRDAKDRSPCTEEVGWLLAKGERNEHPADAHVT